MKQISTKTKRFIFFMGMTLIGTALILAYLVLTGNTFQKFTDIVVDYTSLHASNKTAERNLFYLFSLLGAFTYTFYYFATQRNAKADNRQDKKTGDGYLYGILALLTFFLFDYFVYQKTDCLLLAGIALALIAMCRGKQFVVPSVMFLFVNVYAIYGFYRIYVWLGGERPFNIVISAAISLLLSFLLLMVSLKYEDSYARGILLSETAVPFTMLLYLVDGYRNGEETVRLHVPYRIQIIIHGLIAAFLLEAVLLIKKNWNKKTITLKSIISFGTCISILSFNRFSGTGAVLSTDLHHPFENIIGYSQVIELGQKLFEEYIPISGMYSMIQGFFLSFFGHGQAAYYYLTQNLFYFMIIVLIVILLKKQISGEWVLLVSMILPVTDYNRIVFILPVMLLLSCPGLIKRKNLWLKAWYLSSLVQGLYYPVFGAAVCIGYVPLGIYQIISYARSGKLIRDAKTVSFWLFWLICLVPLILGLPCLLGTARHMLAMGGQTVYANGITRFGQLVPDGFLPYLGYLPVRLILYYLFSYFIVICIVWVSVALCLKVGEVYIDHKKFKAENPVQACIAISVGITMLISFSYTVIRMDINGIYARSAGVVYAAFVMFVIIAVRYLRDDRTGKCLFVFAMSLIAAVSAEGLFNREGAPVKWNAYYSVPEGYVYAKNNQVERLGVCFVEEGVYETIEDIYNKMAALDRENSYLGIAKNFGLHYLCNIKGGGTIELGEVKGYSAAQETVDLLRRQKTIVGEVDSVNNYYLYHWLVTSGEYIWVDDIQGFEPSESKLTAEEARVENKNYVCGKARNKADLGRSPGSFGASMDSLRAIFSSPDVKYIIEDNGTSKDIVFYYELDGDEADFVYMEFDGMDENYDYTLFNLSDSVVWDTEKYPMFRSFMKKDYNRGIRVAVSWVDEDWNDYSMRCLMSHGKLLLPLGEGSGWLLNKHSGIHISVLDENNEPITVPEIVDVEFLKLREIE